MCSIAEVSDPAATTTPQSRLLPRISAHQLGLFYQKSATLVVLQHYSCPHRLDFFSTYKSCCARWNTRDVLKIERDLNTFYTLFIRTWLQQGHTDGHFLSTNFPAFYFQSIQLKIIALKKTNFHYKNPSSTHTDLLCSFYQSCCVAVWYFSCRQGPFSKPSNIWELTIKRLKSAAATSCIVIKLKWKRQVRRNGCEMDVVEFVLWKGHSRISEVARSHRRNVYPAMPVSAACCANDSTRL